MLSCNSLCPVCIYVMVLQGPVNLLARLSVFRTAQPVLGLAWNNQAALCFFQKHLLCREYIHSFGGPGSSVGIVTEPRAGWSGIESRWGRDFLPVETSPGSHPASCKMGTGSFPGVKCGQGMLLTTHPFQCRGRGRVELYLYPPYGPHQACNRITLPLPLYSQLQSLSLFLKPIESALCLVQCLAACLFSPTPITSK